MLAQSIKGRQSKEHGMKCNASFFKFNHTSDDADGENDDGYITARGDGQLVSEAQQLIDQGPTKVNRSWYLPKKSE